MHKEDLALNKLQWLLCYTTKRMGDKDKSNSDLQKDPLKRNHPH